MNALLYGLVVVIWGTTWIAIFLQQGPVAAPVSIFWRFALASATMMVVLLALVHKFVFVVVHHSQPATTLCT